MNLPPRLAPAQRAGLSSDDPKTRPAGPALNEKRVIIVGGGLAGIAASAALTDAGFHTTLIERRALLGGRATSFEDPTSGELLDNCQHVLLGCCTELMRLYKRLGVADRIEFFETIHFADETGRRGTLAPTSMPSPLHLAGGLLQFDLLDASEKFEIARAMAAIKLLGPAGRDAADILTFEHWLRDHGQSPRTIARFWNVILTSALNEDVSRMGSKYAIQVFQDAFLGDREGHRMGLPNVPLSDVYANAVATELLTGKRVAALKEEDGRVNGVVLGDGTALDADHVILATAPDAARRLLSDEFLRRDPSLAGFDRLDFSPILGIHLWYDRPVMPDVPHLALIGTDLQWLFRKDPAGRAIHGVISAARQFVDIDSGELARQFDNEIRRILPAARGATLERSLIVKEKRATYCPVPGVDAIRPPQRTRIGGLTLAGDYTQTNWPATMEGAVRSGNRAAQEVMRMMR